LRSLRSPVKTWRSSHHSGEASDDIDMAIISDPNFRKMVRLVGSHATIEFQDADFDGNGSVSMGESRHILRRLGIKVTSNDARALLATFGHKIHGGIDYRALLRHCGVVIKGKYTFDQRYNDSLVLRRGMNKSFSTPSLSKSTSSPFGLKLRATTSLCPSKSLAAVMGIRPSSASANRRTAAKSVYTSPCTKIWSGTEKVDSAVCTKVYRHWRQLQRAFRRVDTQRSGRVTKKEFRTVLEVAGKLSVDDTTFASLVDKYASGRGKVSYTAFLKSVVLRGRLKGIKGSTSAPQLRPRPGTAPSRASSRSSASSRPSTSSTLGRRNVAATYRKLRPDITQAWKSLRKDFRGFDRSREGYIPARVFRSVLNRNGIELTEKQFYEIIEHCGNDSAHQEINKWTPSSSGKRLAKFLESNAALLDATGLWIKYDLFLRSVLKSA